MAFLNVTYCEGCNSSQSFWPKYKILPFNITILLDFYSFLQASMGDDEE